MPSSTRRSPERHRLRPAERRRQLIDVATSLFLEHGYANVAVADIARAAGISGPSVYRHFPDKQAILAAVMHAAVDEMAATTATALAVPATGDSPRFENLIAAVVAMAVADPGPLALWRWNRRNLTADQARDIIAASEGVLLATADEVAHASGASALFKRRA